VLLKHVMQEIVHRVCSLCKELLEQLPFFEAFTKNRPIEMVGARAPAPLESHIGMPNCLLVGGLCETQAPSSCGTICQSQAEPIECSRAHFPLRFTKWVPFRVSSHGLFF